MNKQKGFAPIFIIVLIVLVVGGYLIYQEQTKSVPTAQQIIQLTPTPTSSSESITSAAVTNWKTFESTYRLQYPQDWEWKKNSCGQSFSPISNSKNGFSICYYGPGNPSTAEEFSNFLVPDDKLSKTSVINLNGENAIKKTTKDNLIYIFIDNGKVKNKDLITVYIVYSSASDEKIITQILSTFKFTN